MSAPEPLRLTERKGMICIQIHLQPGAARNEMAGMRDGALRIRLTSPPLENRANRQLVEFLARTLGTAKSSIHLVSGLHSRLKTVGIKGVTREQVLAAIAPHIVE